MYYDMIEGRFTPQSPRESPLEMREFLSRLELTGTHFIANHGIV